MLFNSAAFILLFFVVYLLYWQLPTAWKHHLIIIASFIFYGWFSINFLLLFLFLIVFNYYVSNILLENKSKALLVGVIVVDVGMLVFFKYFYLLAEGLGFLVEQATGYSYLSNLRENWINDYRFEIILPIAISFYTFQIVAWVVDCYRGTITERIPFKKFCVFILFFPQFVAGPIMRSTDFISQIDTPRADPDKIINGVLLIFSGVIKKVLIADHIGALTGSIWLNPEKYDATLLLLLLPTFAVRIYCDFSGYTDMARGLAKMLGYEIPENFTGPLLSRSVSELWTRWHITLSSWLRDYIYIPLGGSRQGEMRTAINLLITLSLAGIWHGANWNMLGWGFYIGFFIVMERFFNQRGWRVLPENRLGNVVRIAFTFSVFSISSLLFAAPSSEQSIALLKGIFSFQHGLPLVAVDSLIFISLVGFLFNYIQVNDRFKEWLQARSRLRYGLVPILMLLVGLLVNLYGDASGSFIYFAF